MNLTTDKFEIPARLDTRPVIVIYSTTPWNALWRPRLEYARQLAKRGWDVIYTTGPMTVWDLQTDDWRSVPWLSRFERVEGVLVEHAGRLPLRWPGRAIDVPVLSWHAKRVRSANRGRQGGDLIALVFDPIFLPHVEHLQPRYTVYFQYEALARLPGVNYRFAEYETRLVERSNVVISLTQDMASVLPEAGATRARLLPSAVRIDDFLHADQKPCPDDLAHIPHPRIGYVGSITVALDFDLILTVAQARPDWHFVFIGPVQRDGGSASLSDAVYDAKWQKLRALSNVHWLSQKPAAVVPAYMAHMDVNALWYRTKGDGWWLLGSPIKLYENMAVGKPIIGTGLAAIREYSAYVEVANTTDEWLSAIDRAIHCDHYAAANRRISVAKDNSWDCRADRLESWLLEMVKLQQ